MKKYLDVLAKASIFENIEHNQILSMLDCLSGYKRQYKKNAVIYDMGENIQSVGILLEGKIHIVSEDYNGNRNILSHIGIGEVFGESYACSRTNKNLHLVLAADDSTVLFIDLKRIVKVCSSACIFHTRLIDNLLRLISDKNIILNQKNEILTRRTIREKILLYLSRQSKRSGGNSFTIPFTRNELAEYLSVDRSALSRELSRMRDQGILNYNKNRFTLYHKS